jgi:hypothetical protein
VNELDAVRFLETILAELIQEILRHCLFSQKKPQILRELGELIWRVQG